MTKFDGLRDFPESVLKTFGNSHRDSFLAISDGSSGDAEVEKAFLTVLAEMFDTFCRKQRDYGRQNIAKFGAFGVLVRLSDKVERLIYLQGRVPTNESKRDNWLDAANYGAIGLMCHDEKWPGAPSGS